MALAMPVAIASTPSAPPPDGPQSLYLQSSQARNWRFSARQIEKRRQEGNEAARQRLTQAWALEQSLPAAEDEPEASSFSQAPEFLTVDEEQTLIAYYLARVKQLVKAFALPETVEATALSFIKRFYLRNTCMDYHPKNVMLTCLFLSAKVEDNVVPLRHFATKLAGKNATEAAIGEYSKTVQDLEFYVSQSLQFEFTVHGAHRALHGLFLDVQADVQPTPPSHATLSAILAPARAQLQQSRFTDAELIYPPAQIALACMASVSDEAKAMIRQYIERKEQRATEAKRKADAEVKTWRANEHARSERRGQRSAEAATAKDEGKASEGMDLDQESGLGMAADEIVALLDEINDLIGQQASRAAADNVETIREVDKKLKVCQNPKTVSSSRIAKKRADDQAAAATGAAKDARLGKRNAPSSSSSLTNKAADEPVDSDDEIENAAPAKRIKTETATEEG